MVLAHLFLLFFLAAPAEAPLAQITPKPTPTPTPASTPVFRANSSPTATSQTLASLQSQIRSRLVSPEAARARVGIKIVSLASGRVIYENDAEKYFVPASNMKNFTVAAAMDRLGPNFRYVTSVYAQSPMGGDGVINGDLRIYGRGDVSFSTLFATRSSSDPEIYFEGLDKLADMIAAAGVKRIDGGIVADESYFKGNAIPLTWEWDDLQWYDGAEISALPINNNAMDLIVQGSAIGAPCNVRILPVTTLYQVNNVCTTTARGTTQAVGVKKSLEKNLVTIYGTMPAGGSYTGYITFTRPAELFVSLLKERLIKRGILVTGPTRVQDRAATSQTVEIARLESVPFSTIAAKTMKPSQNMFTETILWTMGEEVVRKASGGNADSSRLGLNVVRDFLKTAGIPADAVVQYDGSGLSRHDLVTPSAIVQLYAYMAKQSPNSKAWRDSLAVGGVDGTLRRRFTGTAVASNFRGKTGTLDQVSALSGYVTTAGGEELVLSLIVNGMPVTAQRTDLIDDIVVTLANFNGRIDQ